MARRPAATAEDATAPAEARSSSPTPTPRPQRARRTRGWPRPAANPDASTPPRSRPPSSPEAKKLENAAATMASGHQTSIQFRDRHERGADHATPATLVTVGAKQVASVRASRRRLTPWRPCLPPGAGRRDRGACRPRPAPGSAPPPDRRTANHSGDLVVMHGLMSFGVSTRTAPSSVTPVLRSLGSLALAVVRRLSGARFQPLGCREPREIPEIAGHVVRGGLARRRGHLRRLRLAHPGLCADYADSLGALLVLCVMMPFGATNNVGMYALGGAGD